MLKLKINKKGFTLIELLAVITVLAIVMILVLTNGGNVFSNTKKASFSAECKNLYKKAVDQYSKDSVLTTNNNIYAKNGNEICGERLLKKGADNINYFVKMNELGQIVEFHATDGELKYSYKSSTPLRITDINSNDVLGGSNIAITCDGAYETEEGKYTGPIYINTEYGRGGQIGGSILDLEEDSYTTSLENNYLYEDYGFYLKLEVINNIVKKAIVCFEKEGKHYCFRGGDGGASYQQNRNLLQSISTFFTDNGGFCSSDEDYCKYRKSDILELFVSLSSDGSTTIGWYTEYQSGGCTIEGNGYFNCYD